MRTFPSAFLGKSTNQSFGFSRTNLSIQMNRMWKHLFFQSNYQSAVDQSYNNQMRFVNSQAEVSRLNGVVAEQVNEYNELMGKLTSVNDKTNETINAHTPEEKTAFYLLWDEWWQEVIGE